MKRYSILTNDMTKCYVCGTNQNIHIHEVFYGKNRNNSIKYGCCIPLCAYHHNMSDSGIHFDKALNDRIKKECQEKFLENYNKRAEDFIEQFGRSYEKENL